MTQTIIPVLVGAFWLTMQKMSLEQQKQVIRGERRMTSTAESRMIRTEPGKGGIMSSAFVENATGSGRVYEGWDIGSVTIKRVWLGEAGTVRSDIHRHGGEPDRIVRDLLRQGGDHLPDGVVVTGPLAATLFDLPYLPESVCIEAALRHLQLCPDLVLSLGGESFVVYCLRDGIVRTMLSSNRCAAGSGEFLVQQFGRMNLDLEAGIRAAGDGYRVKMASRCSVHCKSDATHKLNKGECTPADIAISLIADLALKIAKLVKSANWSSDCILLAGGLTANRPLVEELKALLPGSRVDMTAESVYLEGFGAAVAARESGPRTVAPAVSWLHENHSHRFAVRPPLSRFTDKVRRMTANGFAEIQTGMQLILGVDAGSTTTKAVLLDRGSGRPVAGCYLRTHGNPVQATFQCLEDLGRQLVAASASPVGDPCRIMQAAVTGSGRDLVSVYLDNCLSFNEILAHARAAREVAPEVDTLFELGGQDAKFVALQSGIPVDYAMNDGCSAGTGSFLEEAAASDMQVPIEEIGPLALSGSQPVAFGERCAAFINSEVRSALQQGAPRADVLAGLIYAITDNYLSRVVGSRHIGHTVLLQGGVALNPALAPAIAARTGMNVLVPPHPELMGCIGAAHMAEDLLAAGVAGKLDRDLNSFGTVKMETRGVFTCTACENLCDIRQIALNEQAYPFGGLCAKWEMQRRPKALHYDQGTDLVGMRNKLMFSIFAPAPPAKPRGRIGLPLALSTYELYPFYAKLLAELGYEVVLSRPGLGNLRTYAPCYPGEIAIAAVDDLFAQGVDYVLLPSLREFQIPEGHSHAYLCPVVNDLPGVIRTIFEADATRILTPEIGLSEHLLATTEREIIGMADRLGIREDRARKAVKAALDQQSTFEKAYQEKIQAELNKLKGPAVILVGRPYAAFAPEVNLTIPRKITSRGFAVIPGDGLPFVPPANERDVWHFTQRTFSAVEYARQHEELYVCALSCFSCGPDAIAHHRLRHEMEGEPFCFLEIDSHTAHAGIETRIGAFLDIIEERRRRPPNPESRARQQRARARIERKGGKFFVVDSKGQRLGFDDQRVLHVLLEDLPRINARMKAYHFSSLGWRTVTTPDMSFETLQKARRVCSGRECLPFLAMMGKVVAHLESRPPGEVTVFHLLEQEGPCQIGNWFDVLPLIVKQLGQDDAVAAWPTINNNYLGGGEKLALLLTVGVIAGDLMAEVRSSLRCLSVNPEAALKTLDTLEEDLLAAARRGPLSVERELRRISGQVAAIPLRARPADTPKVLLFGGINRIFVDKPVREFFEKQGILTKTNDISEFLSLLEFEWIVHSGFAHGHIRPEEQYSVPTIIGDLIGSRYRSLSLRALRARIHCLAIEFFEKRWHRIMATSGLLFSPHIPFREVAREAQDMISWNSCTEAPCTLGRYFTSLAAGAFDGYINIGAFNCAPANSATAVINALSRRGSVPYAAIEADGTVVTPSQVRQLETVAAQCLRRRQE
jgi:predicted CoA-substrate-specific enzyme activase